MEVNDFHKDLAAFGIKLHEDVLRGRAKEIQRYVLMISAIVLLTSLGIYSFQEIHVGPSVLILKKAGWISSFELLVLMYFSILYWLACWIDLGLYDFKKAQAVAESRYLLDDGYKSFIESQNIYMQMSEIMPDLLSGMSNPQPGQERHLKSLQAKYDRLGDSLKEKREIANGKNKAIYRVVKRSNLIRKYVFWMEVIVPTIMVIVATISLLKTAQWNW